MNVILRPGLALLRGYIYWLPFGFFGTLSGWRDTSCPNAQAFRTNTSEHIRFNGRDLKPPGRFNPFQTPGEERGELMASHLPESTSSKPSISLL